MPQVDVPEPGARVGEDGERREVAEVEVAEVEVPSAVKVLVEV